MELLNPCWAPPPPLPPLEPCSDVPKPKCAANRWSHRSHAVANPYPRLAHASNRPYSLLFSVNVLHDAPARARSLPGAGLVAREAARCGIGAGVGIYGMAVMARGEDVIVLYMQRLKCKGTRCEGTVPFTMLVSGRVLPTTLGDLISPLPLLSLFGC